MRRLTVKETCAFISEQLGFDISEDHIRHVRMYIKQDSAMELSLLRKDRDYCLQRMFWDRLGELAATQPRIFAYTDKYLLLRSLFSQTGLQAH